MFKTLVATACVAALAATSVPVSAAPLGAQPAQIDVKNAQVTLAGHRGRRYRRHVRRRHYSRHYHRHRYYRDDSAAVAWGLFGLAAGLAIANSQPRTYSRSSCAPWTDEWYDYCEWRYRTFDPNTGYFYARPGVKQFCTC